jgi:hypothetical protein
MSKIDFTSSGDYIDNNENEILASNSQSNGYNLLSRNANALIKLQFNCEKDYKSRKYKEPVDQAFAHIIEKSQLPNTMIRLPRPETTSVTPPINKIQPGADEYVPTSRQIATVMPTSVIVPAITKAPNIPKINITQSINTQNPIIKSSKPTQTIEVNEIQPALPIKTIKTPVPNTTIIKPTIPIEKNTMSPKLVTESGKTIKLTKNPQQSNNNLIIPTKRK